MHTYIHTQAHTHNTHIYIHTHTVYIFKYETVFWY